MVQEGYLGKRVVPATPIALPVITVRLDLLSDLEGKGVRATLPVQRVSASGKLILGRVDGADATLDHTPLIVGAHYDGVGDDPGGFCIAGPADNAASVAVVLELARVVQRSSIRPRVDSEAMQLAARLLLATIWRIAF
jgi:aminopeptidase YwaD